MNTVTKRFLSVTLAAFLAITLLLSGCGGASSNATAPQDYGMAASSAAPSMDFYTPAPSAVYESEAKSLSRFDAQSGEMLTNIALENRKVVRHGDLSLETMEFDEAYARIPELVKEAGGYIDSQYMEGRSMHYAGDYYERRANIYARVPSERLDEVSAAAGALCNVVSQSERIDDITDAYFDSEARLKTLELQEARLLAILEKADTLTDVITLERALSEVRYEIESLKASLLRMDKQVAYSYLNISLQEVVDYTIPVIKPKTFGQRLGESLSKALHNLTTTFEVLLFLLIENLPVILVFAVFILIILLVARTIMRAWRKHRPKKTPVQTAPGAQIWTPGQAAPSWQPGHKGQPPQQQPPLTPPGSDSNRDQKDPGEK